MHTLALISSQRTWSHRHLLLYCFPTFFIALAETGMAYTFPQIIVDSGVSNTIMGLIFGIGAFLGIFTDVIFPRVLKLKGWKAQFLVSIGLAFSFPLLTLGGIATGGIALFFVATVSWYIFYELMMISQRSFVVGDDKSKAYSKDWGYIYFTYLVAGIAGPIIVQSISAISMTNALLAIMAFTLVAFIFAIFAAWIIKERPTAKQDLSLEVHPPLISEFRYFHLFTSKLFPVMLVAVTVLFIEEMFWNFGALLGESLNIVEGLNWLIITLFSVPMLIGPFVLSRFPILTGKKRLSLLGLFLAGSVLSLAYVIEYLPLLFVIIFATGIALSFAMPLNDAVFSDYQKRSGRSGLYLISLIRITACTAYFFEPIIAGILSDLLGYKTTFAIVGLVTAVIAALLLLITPKKIHLPQKELHTMELEVGTLY